MLDHEQHQENVGAYLLRALPEPEAEALESHLASCAECMEEIERLRPAVDALPRSATQFEAPTGLKKRVMRTARHEGGRRPGADRASLREWLGALRPRLPALRPAGALAVAGVLVAVAVAAGFGAARLADDDDGSRTIVAQVDRGRAPTAAGTLTAPEDTSEAGAVLEVSGLPAPSGGRVYQVWLKRGRSVVPSSLFDVGRDRKGSAGIPGGLEDVDAVMVTRERRGGARVPTEAPLLVVRTT